MTDEITDRKPEHEKELEALGASLRFMFNGDLGRLAAERVAAYVLVAVQQANYGSFPDEQGFGAETDGMVDLGQSLGRQYIRPSEAVG